MWFPTYFDMAVFNYCCCCSLRTGSLIVGWVELILGIIFLCFAHSPLMLFHYRDYADDSHLKDANVALIFLIIDGLLRVVANALLLYGIYMVNSLNFNQITQISSSFFKLSLNRMLLSLSKFG